MATFLIQGAGNIDHVEADTWAEAEAKAAALGGEIIGEIVSEHDDTKHRTSFALTELKFMDAGDAEMSFKGYGAVFNNVDDGGDKILPGAFSDTLSGFKASGKMPTMLYQHGIMGGGPALPAGVWTKMVEDSHGLYVEGKLTNHSLGRDLYPLLKDGGIGGMSIGYRVKDAVRPQPGSDARRMLKTLSLIEVSLVNTPMNSMAGFTAIKSADDLKSEIKTLAVLGDLLREAKGWSRAQTEAVLSNFQAKSKQGEPDAETAALAAAMMRAAKTLKS